MRSALLDLFSRSMSSSILVIGGTGTIGTALLQELSRRQVPVRALVRSRAQAAAVQSSVVLPVVGNLQTPTSLDAALDGIERVFLLSPSAPDQVVLQGNVVEAIQRTDRPIHIVKVSALGAGPEAPVPLARWHAVTESQIRNTALPATFLRPHVFMQNLLGSAETIASDGLFFGAIGDTPLPFIDARDVAAVAAEILIQGEHEERTYTLTGPQSLSYTQMIAIFSSVLGRSIRYVDLPLEQYHEMLVGMGCPTWWADNQTALARWFQQEAPRSVTSSVIEITGHPSRTFERFVQDHRADFNAGSASRPCRTDGPPPRSHQSTTPRRPSTCQGR